TPAFAQMVKDTDAPLRRVVSYAVLSGLPVPALSSALSYFDAYRRGRGTANRIQAQRESLGAHGFDRVDGVDKHHGPRGSGLDDLAGPAGSPRHQGRPGDPPGRSAAGTHPARHRRRRIVVDCGLGVSRALVEAGMGLGELDLILITHLHSDHV